jgi:hypothetical protein
MKPGLDQVGPAKQALNLKCPLKEWQQHEYGWNVIEAT